MAKITKKIHVFPGWVWYNTSGGGETPFLQPPKKENPMNNVLFFLLPKAMCAYLYDDYTVRQALEKMEAAGYQALPILNRRGEYRGTITEGDLLWAIKNVCYMDIRQAEAHRIMEIYRRKDNVPVRVTTSMHELIDRASTQNFVPVVDDKDAFIGIVKRSSIVQYCKQALFPED